MISALLAGLIFGATAGLAPGPLMALTVTQTVRHGTKQGLLVALAPFITDLPIIAVSLLVLTQLSNLSLVLGVIALVGAIYVLYLAYETFRIRPIEIDTTRDNPRSLRRGATINALSPHPYLFWATVGGPFVLRTSQDSSLAPWLFIAGFYVMLVGGKVTIALLVGRFRTILTGKVYLYTMKMLALVLAGFAIFLFTDAIELLTGTTSF